MLEEAGEVEPALIPVQSGVEIVLEGVLAAVVVEEESVGGPEASRHQQAPVQNAV